MPKEKKRKVVHTEDPEWEKLEKVIAEIQQTLAPDAEVTHKDQIRGKSGTIRKLDVSIKSKIGINPVLIDIDAKHHAKPVERGDVAKFAEQVKDVGPCIGIMISDLSFDRGAKYVARDNNIILKTFTEANETDWKQVFGSHPMLFMTLEQCTVHEAWMPESRIGGVVSQNLIPLNPNTALLTEDLKYHPLNDSGCTIEDLFLACYGILPRPRPTGRFKMEILQPNPPYYIHFSDRQLISPPSILVDASMSHKKYPITYDMAKGLALRSDTDNVEAMKIFTNEFMLSELRNSQEGIVLTKEEWEEHERTNKLGEYKIDDSHLYSLEFIATPPSPQK